MNGDRPLRSSRASFFAKFSTIRRKATISLLAVVGVGAALLLSRWQLAALAQSYRPRPQPTIPASVKVVPVQEETVVEGIHYSGVVKELQKVELSFRVGGTIAELRQIEGPGGKLRPLHEGDVLPQGAVLARLDEADYQREQKSAAERFAAATSRSAQAEADAHLAQTDHARVEQLFRRRAAQQAELDAAAGKLHATQAASAAAKGDAEAANIQLQQATANVGYCTLRVPFAEGTVAARYVEAQERVAAHQRAFLLLDLSSVVVGFGVPDSLVGKLALGQPLEVESDAFPGERFEGVVHKIGSTADPQTRTYLVEVRIDAPKGLRPGMTASVLLRREQKACLIPLTAAARASNRGTVAYRVTQENGVEVVRQVPIELQDVVDQRATVKLDPAGGLKVGDRVVAVGVHRLYDGQPVHAAP